MRKTEKDPLAELHKIRKEIYEETKHMSASEYIKYIRKEAAKLQKSLKNKKSA